MKAQAEEGNLIVLGLGIWVLVISLILVIASAVHIHNTRRDLLNYSDALALELAQDLSDSAYYGGTELLLVPEPPASGVIYMDADRVSYTTHVEDDAVVVTLVKRVRIAFIPEFLASVDEVELTVASRAELRRMP